MGRVEVREPTRRRRAVDENARRASLRMHPKSRQHGQEGSGQQRRGSPSLVDSRGTTGRTIYRSTQRTKSQQEHRRVDMTRDHPGFMMKGAAPTHLDQTEQVAYNTAEAAAKKLLNELQSKGYDPQNGGELLKLGSLDSSGSTVQTDRYQTSPGIEYDNSTVDETRDDRNVFASDHYRQYSRQDDSMPSGRQGAVKMTRDHSIDDSRKSRIIGNDDHAEGTRRMNDDWTHYTRDNRTNASSRETDGYTQATDLVTMLRSGDTASDDYSDGRTYDSRSEYTGWTRDMQRQEERKKLRNEQPRRSSYDPSDRRQGKDHRQSPPPKMDDTSGSSSDLSEAEFRNAVTDSFEMSFSSETFSKVVGHNKRRHIHTRAVKAKRSSPVDEVKPRYIGAPPQPSQRKKASITDAKREQAHARRKSSLLLPAVGKEKSTSPAAASAATDLRTNFSGREGKSSKDNRRIPDGRRSPPLAADMTGSVGFVKDRSHFFPKADDQKTKEDMTDKEDFKETLLVLKATTAEEAPSRNTDRKDRNNLRAGAKGRAKASLQTNAGYQRNGEFIHPRSETSTANTPQDSTFSPRSQANSYWTNKSLLDDATLLSAAESSLQSTVNAKDEEPSRARGTMTNRIIRLLPGPTKFGSSRQSKDVEKISSVYEEPPNQTLGLVSREKIFADLQQEGIDPSKHRVGRWKHAGSAIGKVVDPVVKREQSLGELTNEGEEWSIVSRESECVSESEHYREVTECPEPIEEHSPKQEGKKKRFKLITGFLRRLQHPPQATKSWEAHLEDTESEEEMKHHFANAQANTISSTKASQGSSTEHVLEGSAVDSTKASVGSSAKVSKDDLFIPPPSLGVTNASGNTKRPDEDQSLIAESGSPKKQKNCDSLSSAMLNRKTLLNDQNLEEGDKRTSVIGEEQDLDQSNKTSSNSTKQKPQNSISETADTPSPLALNEGEDGFDYVEAGSRVISEASQAHGDEHAPFVSEGKQSDNRREPSSTGDSNLESKHNSHNEEEQCMQCEGSHSFNKHSGRSKENDSETQRGRDEDVEEEQESIRKATGSFVCADSVSTVSYSISSDRKTRDSESNNRPIGGVTAIESIGSALRCTNEKQEAQSAASSRSGISLPFLSSGETGRSSCNADSVAAIATAVDPKTSGEHSATGSFGQSGQSSQVQSGVTISGQRSRSSPFACGQMSFAYPQPQWQTLPKKSVRFSEDLALIYHLSADPESQSISLSESIDSRQSLDSLARRKDIDEVHPAAMKKKGVVAWLRSRLKRNRRQQRTTQKMTSIEEDDESSADSDDRYVDQVSWKLQPDRRRVQAEHSDDRSFRRNDCHPRSNPDTGIDEGFQSLPIPRENETSGEGIELVARRTKAGKQAVLIAKTNKKAKHDLSEGTRTASRKKKDKLDQKPKKELSCKSATRTADRPSTKKKGKGSHTGSRLRLRFFKPTNKPQGTPVQNDNLTTPPIARVQKLNEKGISSFGGSSIKNREHAIVRAPHSSLGPPESKQSRQEQRPRQQTIQEAPKRRNNIESETVRCPRSKKEHEKQNTEGVLKKNPERNGERIGDQSHHTNQWPSSEAGAETSEGNLDAMFGTISSSTKPLTATSSKVPRAQQPAYVANGSDPTASPVVDVLSWLMSGIFPSSQPGLERGSTKNLTAPNNGNSNNRPSTGIVGARAAPHSSQPQPLGRFYADSISSHESSTVPGKKIPEDRWREILDATETLASRYQEQKEGEDDSALSISDETINEVNEAIQKFREHASRLGMDEKELMAHVRDDDRSLHTRSVQSLKKNHTDAPQQQQEADFVTSTSNRFLDMYEYYFGIPQQEPGSALTLDSSLVHLQ